MDDAKKRKAIDELNKLACQYGLRLAGVVQDEGDSNDPPLAFIHHHEEGLGDQEVLQWGSDILSATANNVVDAGKKKPFLALA